MNEADNGVFAAFAANEMERLSDRGRLRVILVDALRFDPQARRWWKPDPSQHLARLFLTFQFPLEDWPVLLTALADRDDSFARCEETAPPRGIPGPTGVSEATLPEFEELKGKFDRLPTAEGFWNVQHAALPARAFLKLFPMEEPTRAAAKLLTADQPDSLVAHTLLVRSPLEWFDVLRQRVDWRRERLIQAACSLSEVMRRAGIRPPTVQRPRIVSPDTPLHTVRVLAGDAFVPVGMTRILLNGGVETIRDLRARSPEELITIAPLLPSDVRAIKRTLRVFGYSYDYDEHEIATTDSAADSPPPRDATK
jgi:hypothetical protein